MGEEGEEDGVNKGHWLGVKEQRMICWCKGKWAGKERGRESEGYGKRKRNGMDRKRDYMERSRRNGLGNGQCRCKGERKE